jgi:hypothetical protein
MGDSYGANICRGGKMIGAEQKGIQYTDAERPPTTHELELWSRVETLSKRVSLLSYMSKAQFKNILLTYQFCSEIGITPNEPSLPELEKRMHAVVAEIQRLNDIVCEVNRLKLGIRLTSSGNDLDIVDPQSNLSFGWVIPAVVGAVILIGIIARWVQLESEVSEITARYNGILSRTDMALCEDPNSQQCQDWEHAKQTGGYYKRQTMIDSVKSAVKSAGTVVKKGLSAGLVLSVPLLIWSLTSRRK